MPNSIFNYNVQINGKHDARIKGLIADVSSIIEESLDQGGKESLIPLLFVQGKSNRQSEYIAVEDALGNMHPTLDGDKPKSDKRGEIGGKRLSHILYTLDTMVTQVQMEDSDYGLDIGIKNSALQLPRSYYNTREIIAQNAYIFGNQENFKFEGAPIDLTTYDGKPLFAKNHTYGAEDGHAFGEQANYFCVRRNNATGDAGFMAELLAALAAEIGQMKNANGLPQNFLADTVFTMGDKRHTKLNTAIRQAAGSEYFPSASFASNAINTQNGQWNYKALPFWQGATPEIMVMSQTAKDQEKSLFLDRIDLDIDVYTENGTKNVHWSSRARWGLAHVDYKHVVRCMILGTEDDVPANTQELII